MVNDHKKFIILGCFGLRIILDRFVWRIRFITSFFPPKFKYHSCVTPLHAYTPTQHYIQTPTHKFTHFTIHKKKQKSLLIRENSELCSNKKKSPISPFRLSPK